MSLYSLMELAAEGRLSMTVRHLWEKRNGSNPVSRQSEVQSIRLVGWIWTWLSTVFFIGAGVGIFIETMDEPSMPSNLTPLLLVVLMAEWGMFIPTCYDYMPKATNSRRGFADLYEEACKYLFKSQFSVSQMEDKELLEAASARMNTLGREVKIAEDQYGEYSPEKARAKKEFEEAHQSFKLMGWIEDLGYGAFIPKSSELTAAAPAESAP